MRELWIKQFVHSTYFVLSQSKNNRGVFDYLSDGCDSELTQKQLTGTQPSLISLFTAVSQRDMSICLQ